MGSREALLYEKMADNPVCCNLCAHSCVIADGKKGICRVRENRGGTLYTLVYGCAVSQPIDPTEKKPLGTLVSYPFIDDIAKPTLGILLAVSAGGGSLRGCLTSFARGGKGKQAL